MVSFRNLRFRCIRTELMVGITHCRAAATSNNALRKASNIQKARKAYKAALEIARETKLTRRMRRNVRTETAYLRELLETSQPSKVILKFEPRAAHRTQVSSKD